MIAWVDAGSGIAGDMLLAALIDAGCDERALGAALAAIPLGEWSFETRRVERGGLRALGVEVRAAEAHSHRSWADIRALVGAAELPRAVRDDSLRVFGALAAAEADAHGVEPDEVTFHEIGAVDSIVDVVGCVFALHSLGVERVTCSPLALGGGTVEAAHGTLPVPAPATERLVRGLPAFGGDPALGELTTPTGAALAATLADAFGPMPPMTVVRVGHGAGRRELPAAANILRVFLGDESPCRTEEEVALLETNVDHISPEHLASSLERVLEAGALDVWQVPIVMKKGRSASTVCVLCLPAEEGRLTELLLNELGTLGVRRSRTRRTVAEREVRELDTSLGRVRFKVTGTRARPEADDVARLARASGLPVDVVAARLAAEACSALGLAGEPPGTA